MSKATILGRLEVALRFSGCILAALPTTIIPPLPLTILFSRRFRREDTLRKIHGMVPWARFCRKHLLKIRLHVQGQENLPEKRRGYMFISNHQSYVDILVLMDALDTVSFLSKDLIKYLPLIGQHAWAGGTIYFNRGDKVSRQRALDETLKMCLESTAVVVFPEGTRSEDGQLRPKIHPGAMEGAWQKGIKIIPVGLDGTFYVVPKSMDRVELNRPVVVSIGQPMDPRNWPDAASWVEAVWGRVRQLHEESRQLVEQAEGREPHS
jgi:1-acyl-sn-glycerol-3-phosphate acyltransferase